MHNKKVGIISQARMTSTRLPKKVLMETGGKSMLAWHVERLKWSGLPVIIATTVNATDDVLVDFCKANGLPYYRGDENHVLSRYYECAKENGLDVIVRVTSDCPLIDGNLIKESVGEFLAADDEKLYLSNCIKRTFPRGLDFEIFSFTALKEAYHMAKKEAELEHVTVYINTRPEQFHFEHVVNEEDASSYRITLDTEDDFRLMKTLIEDYDCTSKSYKEIIAVLDANPHLAKINAHIEQKKIEA